MKLNFALQMAASERLVELMFGFDVGSRVITYREMVASFNLKCHAGTPSSPIYHWYQLKNHH